MTKIQMLQLALEGVDDVEQQQVWYCQVPLKKNEAWIQKHCLVSQVGQEQS